jgi:hypothetical protein
MIKIFITLPHYTGICTRSTVSLSRGKKWYEHWAQKVSGNDKVKVLWGFHVQSDHVIEHCRPDLLLVDNVTNTATIIDFAVPGDTRIADK